MPVRGYSLQKMCFGLSRRLTAVFGLLIVCFVASVVYLNVQIQLGLLEERLQRRITHLSELATEVSLPYLIDQRVAELEVIYDQVASQDDVAYIFLLDERGYHIVSGSESDSSGFLQKSDDQLAARARSEKVSLRHREKDIVHAAVPILVDHQEVGTLRYGVDLGWFHEEIYLVWSRNFRLGLIFVVAGVAISWIVSRRISQPLKRLTQSIEAASAGDLNQTIRIRTNNEIEILAGAFNTMIASLRAGMQEIHFLAFCDPLTGLPNRTSFKKELSSAVERARVEDRQLAVMFLDIDHFKDINDVHGHHAGDELLRALARKLQDRLDDAARAAKDRGGAVEASPVFARLGGDEFVVILPDIAGPDEVEETAVGLLQAIADPFVVAGIRVAASTSIGCALYPQHGLDEIELLKTADMAMYQAKRGGRNRFQVFDPAIAKRAAEQARLEKELEQAIERDELELYLQPQIRMADARMVGAEALLRWNHPTRGLIAPDLILPAAAGAGLMPAVGRFVVKRAAELLRRDLAARSEGFRLSINLGPESLNEDGFAIWILGLLLEQGLSGHLLCIEITESTAMASDAYAVEQMEQMRSAGVEFAVDDFGMGYSNLGRLAGLDFEVLKIDRSLLAGIGESPASEDLLRSILQMARALSLAVVAEGVETETQFSFLAENGCEMAQGFLLARPMPSDQFGNWVRDNPWAVWPRSTPGQRRTLATG